MLAIFSTSVFIIMPMFGKVNTLVIISICVFLNLLCFFFALSKANKFEAQEDKIIIYQAIRLWKKKVFFYKDIIDVIIRDGEGNHLLKICTKNRNYRFSISSELQAIIQGHLREKGVKVKEKASIYQKYGNL